MRKEIIKKNFKLKLLILKNKILNRDIAKYTNLILENNEKLKLYKVNKFKNKFKNKESKILN